ncbi:MAG: response regulator transcription factor FixJ [Hyphomicrobiales bacterium]|nr:response regulator transcription factor FixJ [Hyphomicrobiales bacterium]
MRASPVVHVIDDDEVVRDSLSFLLETAGLEVRAYDSATVFLHTLPAGGEGCVVTDVRMPTMTGTEMLARLKNSGFVMPVIVITGHGDVPLAVEAMKLGAFDFIEKPFDDATIVASVEAALREGARRARNEAGKAGVVARLSTLSQRERQVLDGLVAGLPNKTIAYDLGISPRTVEVYRANVMTKMEAGSLSDIVRMALLAGVVSASDG